jgi:hypothetical protein
MGTRILVKPEIGELGELRGVLEARPCCDIDNTSWLEARSLQYYEARSCT